MNRLAPLTLLLALLVPAAARAQSATYADSTFPHEKHRTLFPTCVTCHAGALDASAAIWPAATQCASCHDGQVQKRVTWTPPAELPHTNLKFQHRVHADSLRALGKDSVACTTCHQLAGAPYMQVRLGTPERCLECHGVTGGHVTAPDTACVTCHLPLARAVRLTAADIKRFEKPASHNTSGFMTRDAESHGALAKSPTGVAASCATCHTRNFCIACHVDAPDVGAIRAMELDPRGNTQTARLAAPATHRDSAFVFNHGPAARAPEAGCRTCHAQASCLTCHLRVNGAIAALASAGAGRAPGAVVQRKPPLHTAAFLMSKHGIQASASPTTCASCHLRQDCLQCHRPVASSGPAYHQRGFLAAHPAAAYSREQSCAQCHNQGAFCQSCHKQAGLTAAGNLGHGYHDAKPGFLLGHGQAARQSLETCTSCHVERDCLTCHGSTGVGRRFNPHGPGFDAARLKAKNPDACRPCHGTNIPG